MKTHRFTTIFPALAAIALLSPAAAGPLESGFANPPAQAALWCYYYWISDNISKEGITKGACQKNQSPSVNVDFFDLESFYAHR